MSLDPPAYITSLQNNIRNRPISWEGAVRAKTITETDLLQVKSIDKVRKEQRRQVVEENVDEIVKLLLGDGEDNGAPGIFKAAAKRPDIIQYMLVLTGDLIDGESDRPLSRASYFSINLPLQLRPPWDIACGENEKQLTE